MILYSFCMVILCPFFVLSKGGKSNKEDFIMAQKNTQEYPVRVLRENLRQRSTRQAALLSRSVGRLTSYDAQPCLEYRQEVAAEYEVIDCLLYTQQCRSALEACIGSGFARLRYRWRDGRVTETRFRRVAPGRVRVSGLQKEAA